MTKFFILIALLIKINLSFAAGFIDLPSTQFEAKAENIQSKINEIIANPEPILHRYKPVGLKIKNKIINHNQIQFLATKEVLGISRTVLYNGTLNIELINPIKNQNCFLATLDFNGSGELIIDNIEQMLMTVCTSEIDPNHLKAQVKTRLLKGNNYGGLIGGIAKNLIADQLDPILVSIKEEIESL